MKTKTINIAIIAITLALICLLLAGISCIRSEGRDIGSKIWGNVRSVNPPEDNGLNNTFISLDNTNIFAITKRDGYFMISGIPDGFYEVSLWKFGHKLYSDFVTVSPDDGERGLTMDSPMRFGDAQIIFSFPQGKFGDNTLAATILDEDKQPVKDAEISLIYINEGYFHVTRTDHAGSFYFVKELKPNPDLLMIDAQGFKPAIFGNDDIQTFMENDLDGAQVNMIPIERDIVEPEDPKGSVSGYIYDDKNQPLTGIKVAIYPKDEDTKPVASIARIINSNNIGVYTFEFIPAGEYVIWAGHPNYFPKEIEVTIDDGEAIIEDIILEEATNAELHPFFREET